MPKIAHISADFMRKNEYLMANLTPQQQKIWFVPCLALADHKDISVGDTVSLPLEEIRKFLGSKQQNKELKRTLVKAFEVFRSLYNGLQVPPAELRKVEKGRAFFVINDPFALFGQNVAGIQYFKFDLDEIAGYQNGHSQKSRTIPLLWYCLSHKHWSKEHNCWEISFSDTQLKTALGLDRCDYLFIPNGEREFYVEVEKMVYGSTWKYIEHLMKKYDMNRDGLLKKYAEISKDVFFKRWDFEQKVLLPAITELNKGTMINFRQQDVLKRAPEGEKATWVKSYIGKNYTKLKDGICVVLPNGTVIDKNITDFTKLQAGKQYTFLIEKRAGEATPKKRVM